jgi:hypothetical protein
MPAAGSGTVTMTRSTPSISSLSSVSVQGFGPSGLRKGDGAAPVGIRVAEPRTPPTTRHSSMSRKPSGEPAAEPTPAHRNH